MPPLVQWFAYFLFRGCIGQIDLNYSVLEHSNLSKMSLGFQRSKLKSFNKNFTVLKYFDVNFMSASESFLHYYSMWTLHLTYIFSQEGFFMKNNLSPRSSTEPRSGAACMINTGVDFWALATVMWYFGQRLLTEAPIVLIRFKDYCSTFYLETYY